jgi:hypothetical protein
VEGPWAPRVVVAECESKQYDSLTDQGIARRLKIFLEVDVYDDEAASELLVGIDAVSGPEVLCPRVTVAARLTGGAGASVSA